MLLEVFWLCFAVACPPEPQHGGASDADQADRAVATITRLGRASGFQTDPDRFATGLACEAAKEMLIRRAKALIGESLGSPVLSSKSCDGTPIRTKFRASGSLPSGKRVKSSGKQGREILVSNQFLRFKHPVEGWRDPAFSPSLCHSPAPSLHRQFCRLRERLGPASALSGPRSAASSTIVGTVLASLP